MLYMVVEIMGLLIFIGVALLLFARYQGGKNGGGEAAKNLAVSLESLQREMDKASTEAIERMGSHVNRFERLMKEARASDEDLSYHLKEMHALEDRLRKEMAESRALSEELRRERERSRELADELARRVAAIPQNINAMLSVDSQTVNAVPKVSRAINSYEDMSALPEASYEPVKEAQPDKSNFAALLEKSIEKGNRDRFEPEREVYEPSKEAKEALESEERAENPSARAKAMLENGATIEEVMRKTAMGRGAVELLAQMTKKK